MTSASGRQDPNQSRELALHLDRHHLDFTSAAEERSDTIAFVFLVILGMLVVGCAVFKCELLSLIF